MGMSPRNAIAAAAVSSTAAVTAVLLLAPSAADAAALGRWGQTVAEGAGALACGLAARHTRGRARSVWALFSLALAIRAITDGAYAATLAAGVAVPGISVFDLGWLAFYVPLVTGVALLYLRLRPERGWQGVLDGMTLTLAIAALTWAIFLQPLAGEDSGEVVATLLAGLYPAIDLSCLAALGWIVLRQRRAPRWLRWIVAALAFQAVAGFAHLVSTVYDHDVSALAVAAFMAAGWLWALAGAERLAAPERAWAAGLHDRPPRWSEPVPFVLGVGVVAIAAAVPDVELRIMAVAAALIMAVRAMETLSIGRGLITERDRLLVTDPLTGAYNRRFLAAEMDRAFSRASRGGEELSAIALDLDRFKEVNDRLGHDTGDRLLQEVAAAVSGSLRASDVFCRLGGDEFLVLCPATDGAGAAVIAERLRGRIAEAAARVVPEVAVTGSLGIATYPADADAPDTMLSNADAALYAAKRAGRDTVAHFGPLRTGVPGVPGGRW